MPTVDAFATADAPPGRLAEVRRLCDAAFGAGFSDADWEHALGGLHVTVHDGEHLVAHAALVTRTLTAGERAFRTGYVEGVAVATDAQGWGHGTRAMAEVTTHLTAAYELGALSTGEHHFYERLGWERWAGPTFVRTAGGVVRTADEDDGIMVLRFGPSRDLDLGASICCDEREGDDW